MREQTTFTIPPDITREIRQLKKDKDLPSLWRAVQVYFEEKNNQIMQQALETLRGHIARSVLVTAVADTYVLKHPDQFTKDVHFISKQVNKNIDAFSSFLRPEIRQVLKKILGQVTSLQGPGKPKKDIK